MKVEMLIMNAQVYNSYYREFKASNVAVLNGRFLYIGEVTDQLESVETIDAQDRFLLPGLIDIHLHIESSMVTPSTFAWSLISNGVTTIVAEPHEIANVFGVEGVREMIKASIDLPVDILYAIPSSVPATSMETTGGFIDIAEIDALMETGKIQCLGEIMNYVDVIRDPDSKTNRILRHVRQGFPSLVIEGHTPRVMDLDLQRLIAAGVDSDHTHQSVEGLKARIAAGMFIELQEKSMTRDVMDYLLVHDVAERFCLVTDDVMPDSLLSRGHLNHLIRKAVGMGMRPEDAIYAATFTPAARMGMKDRGTVAPGKLADFQLIDDLKAMRINRVFKRGVAVFDAALPTASESSTGAFPMSFYESVMLKPLTEDDFAIRAQVADGRHSLRLIVVRDGSTFTEESRAELDFSRGIANWEISGCAQIAVFERYGKNGNRAHGLIGGDIHKRGAVATTYSHDNHNLLVVGYNARDMLVAANAVINAQGGYCVAHEGKIQAFLPLPVGGILSEAPLKRLASDFRSLHKAMVSLGYRHYSPIMSLSTLSLSVSPSLKITDCGLVDVARGALVPLILQ
jgi:adenine deaminase